MKRKRLTEEQIIGGLKDAQPGVKTDELARRHGTSQATIYNQAATINACPAFRVPGA